MNKLDPSIHKSASLNIFKSRLLQFVRTLENPIGIKYLTRRKLGFSHLCDHKFKHGYLDAIYLLCSCSTGTENTVHYFFTVPTFLLHKIPFSMKLQLLTDPLLIKIISKLLKLSFMETQAILSMITN